ncbi:MAG: hypothetical protein E6J34_04180 [Chloroflexi bacterium]|nr:MAG: hypothetical protein E6J34_04180 [Chloroflexota bacterium]
MISNDILSWYESGLPLYERKRRGHFSTPPLLIGQILEACGYKPEEDLRHLRVIDPACGSGNFLAQVVQRLLAYGRKVGLSDQDLLETIEHNVWGFDPDPVSCFLAEMHLYALLTTAHLLPTASCREVPRLHIHQADGLTFPWRQCQNVDIFLANPPYLAAKNNDLSGYRSARQRGQADSYLFFIELALQIVRPGGWIALVLPDSVLARVNATQERQRLLQETTIHQLWHLANVFPAYVGAVVIVAQKRPPARLHQVAWLRGQWKHNTSGLVGIVPAVLERYAVLDRYVPRDEYTVAGHVKSIAQALLSAQPAAELRYLLSNMQGTLIASLYEQLYASPTDERFVRLSQLVLIRRGEELRKDSRLLHEQCPVDGHDCYPVLRGGVDVRPYGTPIGPCCIERSGVEKPLVRYQAPKLLVVKSTDRLQAALDVHGHVVLQTLYTLTLRGHEKQDLDDLYFLLALLNSRLLRTYVYVLYTAYKWIQPQIEQHVLAHLPIPAIAHSERECIIQRARALQRACDTLAPVVELRQRELYEEQERAICSLYEAALQKVPVLLHPL